MFIAQIFFASPLLKRERLVGTRNCTIGNYSMQGNEG